VFKRIFNNGPGLRKRILLKNIMLKNAMLKNAIMGGENIWAF
jgi:hypothetical protein